jgi:hypothetical protein
MSEVLTSEVVQLQDVRLSFANLDKEESFKNSPLAWNATFLLDPKRKDHKATIDRIEEVVEALIKARWGNRPKGLELCFGYADKHETKSQYAGYAGMYYVGTKATKNEKRPNNNKPEVYNRKVELIGPGAAEWPYNGCRVNTGVTFWTQDNDTGKAIRGNLRRVQFFKNDAPFGAAQIPASKEFSVQPDTADDVEY